MTEDSPRIYLAFRFHVNFYHSYRGDTPDEQGFGKDIRIIGHIIEVLDRFNNLGVPVRATWDIENAFSLERIMPEHSPELITALQRRVKEGRDEIEVMSYNNGLLSAHTAAEFEAAIQQALTNDAGSGLRDLFPSVCPIVRPQEMMYTPLHLKTYPHYDITAISLFYSAVPFNAFSNFIPPLSPNERYNPLTLTYPGIEDTLTLLPAYNHGDIADHLSLRRWLKKMRRQQLKAREPRDLLLLLDADADDSFWYGFDWPLVKHLTAAKGLEGLLESVKELEFLRFTTPCEYLATHLPVGRVTVRQDTADGLFDGYASWAEKWSNHRLWTGIERARILELQARRLAGLLDGTGEADEATAEIATHLDTATTARLHALSTTHFGLSAPVMNPARLETAEALVAEALAGTKRAFEIGVSAVLPSPSAPPDNTFSLLDYVRGSSTAAASYAAKPSQALVRLPLRLSDDVTAITVQDATGKDYPAALRRPQQRPPQERRTLHPAPGSSEGGNAELLFLAELDAAGRQDFQMELNRNPLSTTAPKPPVVPVVVGESMLANAWLTLEFDENRNLSSLLDREVDMAGKEFIRSAVRYGRREYTVKRWQVVEQRTLASGWVGWLRVRGTISLPRNRHVVVEREYLLSAGLPYLYVQTRVRYPETPHRRYNKAWAAGLGQTYDARWREVKPCELQPALYGEAERPLRVWKHNYLDHVSYYNLDYGTFSRNKTLSSFNNHITHAWVAISGVGEDRQERGLLVAQSADAATCFAFCPMRLRQTRFGPQVHLNPFGTYFGRSWRYGTSDTGLGSLMAPLLAGHLTSLAPSYNGRTETFSLLVAPYSGDVPPAELQAAAEAFAYPYLVLSDSPYITPPAHRNWSGIPD